MLRDVTAEQALQGSFIGVEDEGWFRWVVRILRVQNQGWVRLIYRVFDSILESGEEFFIGARHCGRHRVGLDVGGVTDHQMFGGGYGVGLRAMGVRGKDGVVG